ncbi:HAD family hydrolase [candidate division KSB1 bacterium]|nr:HAD family hydrolase [candidate division KSB1 bacterium]RQW01803.1 MAG: HAD family hydrolase [candidate division KSB1 bacterium]
MQKAVFFDRDDTLIVNIPYNGDPDRVELLPGAQEACRQLKRQKYSLFIISNQSGVGRGLITPEQVKAVNDRVLELLGDDIISDVFCCFDLPDDSPDCRKPSNKMICSAAEKYNIDLSRSFMIGDKPSDIQAGINAGCAAIFITGGADTKAPISADFVTDNLLSAAAWIISQKGDE